MLGQLCDRAVGARRSDRPFQADRPVQVHPPAAPVGGRGTQPDGTSGHRRLPLAVVADGITPGTAPGTESATELATARPTAGARPIPAREIIAAQGRPAGTPECTSEPDPSTLTSDRRSPA